MIPKIGFSISGEFMVTACTHYYTSSIFSRRALYLIYEARCISLTFFYNYERMNGQSFCLFNEYQSDVIFKL